jgi:hypothetical protein
MAIQSNKSNKAKNEKAAPAKPVAKAPIPVKPIKAATAAYQPTPDEIRARAYEIYLSEGCKEGSDLENWVRAEGELRAKGLR